MLFKDLAKLKNSSSFSISPENFTGEKSGGARAKTVPVKMHPEN